jgi:hypothetical protein
LIGKSFPEDPLLFYASKPIAVRAKKSASFNLVAAAEGQSPKTDDALLALETSEDNAEELDEYFFSSKRN